MASPLAAKAKAADKPKELQKTRKSGSGPASSICGAAWKSSAVAKAKGRGATHEVDIEEEHEDDSDSGSSSSDSSFDSSSKSPEYNPFDDKRTKQLLAQKRDDSGDDNGDDSDAPKKPKSNPSKLGPETQKSKLRPWKPKKKS